MKNFNRNLQNRISLFISITLMTLGGCTKKEAPLTPSDKIEFTYKLPQGNNDYDQRIAGYFNRWGTYVLYKFTQQDINYQVAGYDTYYKSVPAIETYINPQLDLLENAFFKYYADSTLKKYLPIKLFLCSSLFTGTSTQVNAYLTVLTNTSQGGYQSFAVNGANSNITTVNKAAYRADVNFSFLKKMDLDFKFKQSPIFVSLNASATAASTTADRYKYGFLGTLAGSTIPLVSTDLHSYIQAIVSNPYSYLTDPATTATDATNKGILSPVKDVNGLIRRKYDAIITHYKTQYNIDLQAIGNGQ